MEMSGKVAQLHTVETGRGTKPWHDSFQQGLRDLFLPPVLQTGSPIPAFSSVYLLRVTSCRLVYEIGDIDC